MAVLLMLFLLFGLKAIQDFGHFQLEFFALGWLLFPRNVRCFATTNGWRDMTGNGRSVQFQRLLGILGRAKREIGLSLAAARVGKFEELAVLHGNRP